MLLVYSVDAVTIVLLVALLLAAMIRGGYKSRLNRLYAYCVAFVVVWIPALHVSNDINMTIEVATIADFAVFACSLATAVMVLKILGEMTGVKRPHIGWFFYEPVLWGIVLLAATPLVASGVVRQGDTYGVTFGPLVLPYMATLAFVVVMILITFFRGVQTLHGMDLRRFRAVGISAALSTVFVATLSLVLPLLTDNYYVTEFGLVPILFLVVGLYYGAVRHQLFDIKLVAMRTIAYVLSIATMAIIYFGIAYTISIFFFDGKTSADMSMSPINITLAFILALIFQPIKKFFDHWTNRIFYRDQYSTNEFITRLGQVLTSTTQLHKVLERAAKEIETTLKAGGSMFIVYRDHHPDVVVSSRLANHFDAEEHESIRRLSALHGERLLDVADLEHLHTQEARHLHALLVRRNIALVLPLISAEETIGYLLLGEQMGSGYTRRDHAVLEAVADELMIAIQNARSVQVVRDLNTHLEQRVESATKELRESNKKLLELDATKDEFVSMASHQLRTPLTSIKGYLSMVLEGDAGEINPQQKQLLGEAFTSSERMVHLIGDFLNVSRLQTGKFVVDAHPTDLAAITTQEVEGMHQLAASHGAKITYHQPKRFPTLYIDEGKIRQVIMNFIDNAIFYSPDTGTIKVTLTIEDGEAVLRVIDKGMGVPEDVRQKLFTKFFRAENAKTQRPDGTGIGLFLAKKVIDGHGGNLVFESTLGKGSTFGFRLPIAKLSVPPVASLDDAEQKTA